MEKNLFSVSLYIIILFVFAGKSTQRRLDFIPFASESKDKTCQIICDDEIPTDKGLEVLANGTTNIMVILNNTDPYRVALVIDAKDKSYAFWNGSNGDTIIIDTATKSGVLLCPANSPLIWAQYTRSAEDWLETVPALKDCALKATGGRHFKTSHIPADILDVMNRILARLLGGPLPKGANPTQIVSQISYLVAKLSSGLTGPLQGILSQVKGHIPAPGNVMQVFGVLNAVQEACAPIQGGLQQLLNSGLNLNLGDLLKSGNALDLVTNLLNQIGSVLNLSALLGPVLATVTSLLNFVSGIAGALFGIVGGVVNLVIQVVSGLLAVVLGLINAVLGLGVNLVSLTTQLGIDVLQIPVHLVTSILQLVPATIQNTVLSSFKNFFAAIENIFPGQSGANQAGPLAGPGAPLPGLDKAVNCIEGVLQQKSSLNYNNNKIDNNYSVLNF